MKKLISTILAIAMIVTMFAAMPAFAASSYDASNNAYSIDFNTVGEVGNAANYTLEEEGNYSYRFDYSADPSVNTLLTVGSDANPLVPDGNKIKVNLDLKLPQVDTTKYMKILNFNLGGIQTAEMLGILQQSPAVVRLGTHGSGSPYALGGEYLWANLADVWMSFTFILDLDNGTYDVYLKPETSGVIKIKCGLPLKDASGNVIKNVSGLKSVSINANSAMSSLWSNQGVAKTFYVDNISASDITTSGQFNFEDDYTGLSGAVSALSGSAAVVTTTGKDGNPTKAVSVKYDGLGKYYVGGVATPSNVTTQGNIDIKDDTNKIVAGSDVALGFDFKIDGTFSIAGTYNSRQSYAFPTFFCMSTGAGETTPLVGAKYTRANGEAGWNVGDDTWEIVFSDGRLNWVGSGVVLNREQWATIDLDIDLNAGTYDAYVNDIKVKEGLRIGHITDSSSYISGTSNVAGIKLSASAVGHYNADVTSTWGIYVDNITYGVPAAKKAVSASAAKLVKADSSAAANGEARKYTATVYNPNPIGEYTYFAMRAVDANGEMKDLVFDKVHIPAGRSTFTKEFKKIDEGNYGVKAFFFDLDTLKPYNGGMGAASSAIAE